MTNAQSIPALCQKTAADLCAMLKHGKISSTEITSAYLQSIALQNGRLNACLEVFAAEALLEAAASDARRRAGTPLSPLDGIPIAIKDNIMIEGRLCTCASHMLADFVSPYDASVVLRLKAAGLPLLGRLNLDEFAMGGSSETGAFGIVRNPINPTMVAGGSSGGSAAAVAAGMAPFALGSDTGGSIRQPASFCGILGIKPAYGTVSRYGLVAYASSFDQIGPLAKTARDAALLMNVIAGHDPRDATSDESLFTDFLSVIDHFPCPLRGLRLGMPGELWEDTSRVKTRLSGPARRTLLRAVQRLREMGAEVEAFSLPSLRYALPAYYTLTSAEASSNLARFDGIRYGHQASGCENLDAFYRKTRTEGFGAEVQRRILWGTQALSGDPPDRLYDKARQARARLRDETLQALSRYDVLLTPVTPAAAHPLGAPGASPATRYADDGYTVPANLTGLPALSFPCGQADHGMPIGLGLMGAKNSLPRLLAIASAYEQACPAREGGEAT